MKIILANPRGFCAGVNMAIDSLERALELFGAPLYVYHEIVHNRPVVERFRQLGVVFVDHIDEIPAGATVLYSAHGVAPLIRAQAQGLIVFVTYGIGMLVGAQTAGMVYNKFLGSASALTLQQWQSFWWLPAGFAAAVLLFFIVTFKEKKAPVGS